MSEAPKVIWALADRRKHWQDHAPEDGQHEFHWEKYHHDDTVTALEVKVARLEAALRPFAFLEDAATQRAWELRYNDRFKDWIDFGDMDRARKALEDTQ